MTDKRSEEAGSTVVSDKTSGHRYRDATEIFDEDGLGLGVTRAPHFGPLDEDDGLGLRTGTGTGVNPTPLLSRDNDEGPSRADLAQRLDRLEGKIDALLAALELGGGGID